MAPLGDKLVELREALGLTQAQLAERVPCNPQTISNWETGRRQPRYADLVRLAELLGRPVSWFLGEPVAAEGWRQVAGGLDRMADELTRMKTAIAGYGESPETVAAPTDRLVPVAAQVAPGPLAEVVRGSWGWVRLTSELADGCTVVRISGDVLYPLVQVGDLLGLAAGAAAQAGQLVLARLASGQEVLRRLGADGRLEAVNPAYAPLEAPAAVTAVVRWQVRDFGALGDPAQEAERRLAGLTAAEAQVEAAEARIERGDGQWSELQSLCESLRAEAELLRPIYGASVVCAVARALARSARSLAERGRYAEADDLGRGAERLYQSVERLGERSRDALLNVYNLSQLAMFLGQVDEAQRLAVVAAECSDWTVRWKALKNLDDLRVNYRGEPAGDDLCAGLMALAEEHREEDPVQAQLALSVAYEMRGNVAFAEGDVARARAEAERQVAAAEAARLPYRVATAWLDCGQYALAAGDLAAARTALVRVQALTQAQDLADLDAMRQAHLAALLALEGDVAASRRALFAAARQAADLGSTRARLMTELAGMVLARADGDPVALAEHAAAARRHAGEQGLRPYLAVVDRLLAGGHTA